MQLAGTPCKICRQDVSLESEATWCARCKTVFHRKCIGVADAVCPVCQRAYDVPEDHFRFSRSCPECFRPMKDAQPRCSSCDARTCWDSDADYEVFVKQMRAAAHKYRRRGVVQIGLAGLSAGIFAFIVWASFAAEVKIGLIPGGLLVIGFFLLGDGLFRLSRSQRLQKFE